MKARLLDVTQDSCRTSSTGAPLRSLLGSLKRVHKAKFLGSISYERLRQRMKRGRLGVIAPKARTDLCQLCKAWDDKTLPALKAELDAAEALLSAAAPTYWDGFPEGRFYDKPSWLAAWLAWIEGRASRAQIELDAAASDELSILEATVCEHFKGPEGLLAAVEGWSWHWVIRDQCKRALDTDWSNPTERVLYIHIDFKEPPKHYRAKVIRVPPVGEQFSVPTHWWGNNFRVSPVPPVGEHFLCFPPVGGTIFGTLTPVG